MLEHLQSSKHLIPANAVMSKVQALQNSGGKSSVFIYFTWGFS